MNRDLEFIETWAGVNNFFPNPKKNTCDYFLQRRHHRDNRRHRFLFKITENVQNLGLHIDSKLRWTAQINDVTAKVFGTLHTFRKFSPVLSTTTRMKLAQAVVIPFFSYCDVVYISACLLR